MGSWIGRIYESSNFLFAGSKRHLMGEIFLSPSRPFYQSVITMGLSPIPIEKYKEFASAQFEKCGKFIQPDVVDIVYQRFDGITSYLQRLMNVLFLNFVYDLFFQLWLERK